MTPARFREYLGRLGFTDAELDEMDEKVTNVTKVAPQKLQTASPRLPSGKREKRKREARS